ncbi:hypothetical protein ACWEJ6_11840 [Nonomuraea sp. NPDC004702]
MMKTSAAQNLTRGLIALVASAILLAFAPATSASAGTATVRGCRSGQVCLYKDRLEADSLMAASYTNLANRLLDKGHYYWVFNNGVAQLGADHYRYQTLSWGTYTSYCIHFNTQTGYYIDHGSAGLIDAIGQNIDLVNKGWGGEC